MLAGFLHMQSGMTEFCMVIKLRERSLYGHTLHPGVGCLSVCHSVCRMPVLCLNEWTHRPTVFYDPSPTDITTFQEEVLGSVKYNGRGKILQT